jgi:hypothetical protein
MADDEPDDESDDEAGPDEQPPVVETAADPKRIRKRKLTAQFLKRQADEFWRDVLSTEVGRREIWRLLADAHAFEERFACGPNGFPQPEATWFHAGEQAFGLRFYLTLQQRARELVMQMHDEFDPRFPKRK